MKPYNHHTILWLSPAGPSYYNIEEWWKRKPNSFAYSWSYIRNTSRLLSPDLATRETPTRKAFSKFSSLICICQSNHLLVHYCIILRRQSKISAYLEEHSKQKAKNGKLFRNTDSGKQLRGGDLVRSKSASSYDHNSCLWNVSIWLKRVFS